MPTVSVYDMTGKETGKMELSDAIFGIEPNKACLLYTSPSPRD